MARLARRGEIWMIDLGLAAKVRPCLIISTDFRDDERAVVTYVPRTTSLRGGRFEVSHQAPRFLPGAFDAQNIGTVPTAKLMKFLVQADASTLEQVEAAVGTWLGLNQI
jgi:mRNA interferase MazF